jgi:hypothetical protein
MKTSLSTIHHQLNDWMNELNFYKDELIIFKKRLDEVVENNNKHEIMAQVEHFQNNFILLQERYDILKSRIHHDVQALEVTIDSKPSHIFENYIQDNHTLENEIQDFITSIRNIKKTFYSFLEKVF